jgi:hypothetical protein
MEVDNMIEKTKLSKDVTLVTESLWDTGNRVFTGRLRPPKAEFYDKEEEAIRFEGKTLYINRATLCKYGISLCINEYE